MAQTTQIDPTQLKRPIKIGGTLPATCTAGDLFFNTSSPAGSNLFGCVTPNTWSLQGGFPSQNCWYSAAAQLLQCQNASGNVFTPVQSSAAPTLNQWVDYVSPLGIPHTSQPAAAQIQNAVDQTGNYLNPAWLTGLAWSKLTNVPLTFNAGQVQGRTVAGTAPGDLQYLGWNNAAGQWEPKTLPPGGVASVFGRLGAVTPQAGDYSFPQISGTLGASQLPADVMRTDQGNTVSAGTQDFSNAAHTRPMKSGTLANLPAACSVGEAYFATDAAAGANLYGCTATGVWFAQGGTPYTVASDGVTVGSGAAINLVTGFGLTNTITNLGTQVNVQVGLDSAVVETQSGEQAGTAVLCASTSGSGSNYQCAMNPTLSTPPGYVAGMVFHWKPDVNGAGGATTLNIDHLGAVPVLLADGVSSPASTSIVAGQLYNLWYDGNDFRLMNSAAGAAGAVSSVFGRTGAVIPQTGDYSANQISGLAAVATSGSYNDLSNKPAIPAAQVQTDWNALSGLGVLLNRPALAAVATSGSYNDLSNKPTIPAAQVNSDWNAVSGAAQVLNKPSIPSVAESTAILKGDGTGNAQAAIAGADYAAPGATNVFSAQQKFSGSASLAASYLSSSRTAGAGGVVANELCKTDSSGNMVLPASGDTGILGICMSTVSSGNTVEVATQGIVNCRADNATVVGDLAITGVTTAGACADSGQVSASGVSTQTQIVGRVLTTVPAGQNVAIQSYGPDHYGTKAANIQGNAVSTAAPSNGQVLQWNSGAGQYQPATVSAGGSSPGGASGNLQTNNGMGGFGAASADTVAATLRCSDASGTPNTITCSLSPSITAYTAGTHYWVKMANTNTAAATANFNALGAVPVVKAFNQALTGYELTAGQWVDLVYDGTNLELESEKSIGTTCQPDISGKAVCLVDEFNCWTFNATSANPAGCSGWMATGAGTSYSFVNGSWPHVGIERVGITSSAAGNYAVLFMGNSGPTNVFDTQSSMTSNGPWEAHWIFRLNETSNVAAYVGFSGSPNALTSTPVCIRYDTGQADTDWMVDVNGAVAAMGTTLPDTAWHNLRIRWISTGKVGFSLDGGTEYTACTAGGGCTVSATWSSNYMSPRVGIGTGGVAAANTLDVDFFGFGAATAR